MPFLLLVLLASPLLGRELPAEQEEFWRQLQSLCGRAFAGRMVEGTEPSDANFGAETLVMHVRSCSDNEIRIPFHVGDDRSRTWILTRTAEGLRLKHEHRHEDGGEDKLSQYGGDTTARGTSGKQDFPADAFTAALIPAAKANIWTVQIEPGKFFGYGLRRELEGRRFRVEFDLTKSLAAPPPPWGSP